MKLAFRCGHELDAAVKIDLEACLQRSLPSVAVSWSSDDVDLYHAATLGGDATDRSVLESSEGAPVLPTFATALGLRLLAGLVRVPGLHFRPEMLLSAGHDLELRQELPRSAQGTLEGRISALFDEGWAASLVVDVTLRSESGQVLSVDHYSAFLRGAGGFGGTSAQIRSLPKPTRPPDHRCRCATLPQQALLYRLTGDRNPLHSDPIAAAVAGFPRPILHGACTLGLVSRTLMSEGLVPEASRLARIRVRFEGAVFPGENLLLSVWDEAGRLHLHATTEERRSPVLSAVATPVERQTSERSPARTSPPSAVGTARAIGVPSAG